MRNAAFHGTFYLVNLHRDTDPAVVAGLREAAPCVGAIKAVFGGDRNPKVSLRSIILN